MTPKLPDITFNFSGVNFTLTASDYLVAIGERCMSAFQGMDLNIPGGDLWIIGEYFCLLV